MNQIVTYVHISLWNWLNPPRDKREVLTFRSFIERNNVVSSAQSKFKPIKLNQDEMDEGCKLGLDSWADTCCIGRHGYINSIVEGKTVTARGFAKSLNAITDLPIANCTFAYDSADGITYLLEVNNAIYMGEQMENSLLCPNQCEENGIRIDLRPKKHYSDEPTASTIFSASASLTMPIEHDGPLPFIHVRCPTSEELLTCKVIQLTSDESEWNPQEMGYDLSPQISQAVRVNTDVDDD